MKLPVFGTLLAAAAAVVSSGLVATRARATVRSAQLREERMRLMVEHSSDVTSLVDADGCMTYLSAATERTLGYRPSDMLGVRVRSVIHPDDLPAILPGLGMLMTTPGAAYSYQARYRHADGGWRWLEVISRNLFHVPSVAAVVSNARDVTDTRELQERLRYDAEHDPLTGLANRALFGARLAGAGPDAAVLLVDLDGFKPINDRYGHHTGDAVLVAVAALLRSSCPGALPARLGGDEFAVLLPSGGLPAAHAAADAFRDSLTTPIDACGHRITVAASVGVASGTGDLLRQADEAMYHVKHATAAARP